MAGFAAEDVRHSPVVRAVARVKDAVVNLSTMRVIPARLEEDGTSRVRGLGTGAFIDPHGYIVTNYHVVEKVDRITATTSTGRELPARVINYDEKADLAVLKVDTRERFPYIPLAGAGEPILGETVIAIGNPWGLGNTVTVGIVSAVNRRLPLPNDEIFDDLIQTDASINPGNSGGPLLNIKGELLGINVAIRSNAHRIGFAIPTRKVRRIVAELLGSAPVSIAGQGLEVRELDDGRSSGPALTSFVRVARVQPGSPAERSGFRPGDELIGVEGEDVRICFDIDRALWETRFGDSVKFKIRRNGHEIRSLTLTMRTSDEPSDAEILWQRLGIRVRPVHADRVRAINSQWNGGLLILQVMPGSVADRADFRPGDVLVGLARYEMLNANNIRFVMQLDNLRELQPVEVTLVREGALLPGRTVVLPAYP